MRNPNVELLLFLKNRLALRDHTKDELVELWQDRNDSSIDAKTVDRNVDFLEKLGYEIMRGFENRKRTYRIIDEYEHEILDRIAYYLKISELADSINSENIVGTPVQKGIEWLPLLLESINKRRIISFNYHAFDKNPETKTVCPVILKVYQDMWHLHGYCLREKDFRTYGVDRIQDVFQLEKYELDGLPDVEHKIDYFKMFLGSSRPLDNYNDGIKRPELIKLRVSEFYLDYLRAKPIHPSQKIIDSDKIKMKKHFTGEVLDYTIVTYFLVPNLDLVKFIVSQLGDIIIEEPKILLIYMKKNFGKLIESIIDN